MHLISLYHCIGGIVSLAKLPILLVNVDFSRILGGKTIFPTLKPRNRVRARRIEDSPRCSLRFSSWKYSLSLTVSQLPSVGRPRLHVVNTHTSTEWAREMPKGQPPPHSFGIQGDNNFYIPNSHILKS